MRNLRELETLDSQPWDSNINGGRSVKVTNLGEHTVNDVPTKAVCAVSNSLDGSVLCIYHNYATCKIQSTTIHSKVKLQDYNNTMDDTILMVGGGQTLTTADGSIFPLTMKNGLCYLEQRKPTAWEMKELPRQVMTSIEVWYPLKLEKVGIGNDVNNNKTKLKNNIPPSSIDYLQLPQLIPITKNDCKTLETNKHSMVIEKVIETGDQRDNDRKLSYDEGNPSYTLPYTTDPNNKVEAFSTNVDEMNITKIDEE